VALAPREARFSYVLAVGKAELGDVAGAVEVLSRALETSGNDPQLLQTLAGYLERLGSKDRAAAVRGRLEHLLAE
jgi:Flp pilus assembly protein TadD